MAEAAAAGDGGAGTGTGEAALDELMLELDVDDEMMWGRDGGLAVKRDVQQPALKRASLPNRLWFGLVAAAQSSGCKAAMRRYRSFCLDRPGTRSTHTKLPAVTVTVTRHE